MEKTLMRAREYETLEQLRKRFIIEFLDLITLARLSSVDYNTGYDLVKYVFQTCKTFISIGTVYSTLYFMERKGLIRSELKERKRIYYITPEGKQVIQTANEKIDTMKSLFRHFKPI